MAVHRVGVGGGKLVGVSRRVRELIRPGARSTGGSPGSNGVLPALALGLALGDRCALDESLGITWWREQVSAGVLATALAVIAVIDVVLVGYGIWLRRRGRVSPAIARIGLSLAALSLASDAIGDLGLNRGAARIADPTIIPASKAHLLAESVDLAATWGAVAAALLVVAAVWVILFALRHKAGEPATAGSRR